jgi:hypothetical protein
MKKLIAMVLTLVLVPMLFADAVVRTVDGAKVFTDVTTKDHGVVPYRPGNRQQVLFVEDGGGLGLPVSPDPYWSAVLDSLLGVGNYGWYGPTTDGAEPGPDLATMQGYELVIWNTYDWWSGNPALLATDQTDVEAYLTGGGKVWLIGQDVLFSGTPYAFMLANFDLESAVEDYEGGFASYQAPMTTLAEIEGWDFSTMDDFGSDFYPDALTPTANAHYVLNDASYPAYYPCIFRDDHTSSFWTVDGQIVDPWENWRWVVYYMLDAFGITGIAENNTTTPQDFSFSATTISRGAVSITFALPAASTVELSIYDALGRVRETVISETFSAGSHNVNTNLSLPSGVYFYKMETGVGITATEKLVLVD